MPENMSESLFALAKVLHWFGRYNEMQVVQTLAKKLMEKESETLVKALVLINSIK